MRQLLVTGGAGFIGSNFVRYWLAHHADDRLVVLDALTYAGNLESLSELESLPNYQFVRGDICDAELVDTILHEHSIDTVVHFAAESHVIDRSSDRRRSSAPTCTAHSPYLKRQERPG